MAAVLATVNGGLIFVLIVVFYVIGALPMMGVFNKAGKPGWAAFVPIYNYLVLLEVIGRPWWWLLLLLLGVIPFVGWIAVLVITVIVMYDLSRSFGHGGGFTVGLVLLSWIFLMILWLGSSAYRGPAAASTAVA